MKQIYTVFIESDTESGMYVGYAPGITGAHTYAKTIDELHDKLKEVIELCLEDMDDAEKRNLPSFTGISQIEIAV
jgi:predicted RNase H-like HicB family nuclease